MAFIYNDQRNINAHTHIDQPITCGVDNLRTVTWVDFIDFRNVDNFGFGTNKQSIGGTWLNVLEKLQVCFDNINANLNNLSTRISQLESGVAAISILGGQEIAGTSLVLQSSVNSVWSIESMSTSDRNTNATQPNFILSDVTLTSVKVNVGSTPSWNNYKGTIKFNSYTNGGNVSIGNNEEVTIIASYNAPSVSQIRWEASIKAVSKTNESLSAINNVYKNFDNPYNNPGTYSWSITNSSKFNLSISSNQIIISVKDQYATSSFSGTLTCTNSNASNPITLNVVYSAGSSTGSYTVTFDSNGGNETYPNMEVNYGGYINLPKGPTWNDDDYYTYTFGGWYISNNNYLPYPYNQSQTYDQYEQYGPIRNNITFVAKKVSEPKSFTISFDADGGSPTPQDIAGNYLEVITLPDAPTKPSFGNISYTFNGWQQTSGTHVIYSAGGQYTIKGNMTLKAQWRISYTPDEPTYNYYLGTATDDQIQDQSYVNSLSYNTSGVKPTELNMSNGNNVFIFPAEWGTPTLYDDSGLFVFGYFDADDLGINNPTGKIIRVYGVSADQSDAYITWS